MRLRLWAAAAFAVVAVGATAGCGGDAPAGAGATTPAGAEGFGAAPSAGASTPAVKPTTPKPAATKPVAAAPPLTCDLIRNSALGSPGLKFNDYDGIPLAAGIWSGEDGNSIKVEICGVGDMDGDGNVDGVAAVQLDAGGTGKFWSVAYWRNSAGTPVFSAFKDLGDRTPVQSIAISGNRATVVYLTRGDSDPMAMISIRRTAILRLAGSTLTEVSHFDEPYTP